VRWFLGILLALVVLVVGAALAVPALLDLDARKPALEAEMSRALGRPFAVDGPIELRLLPTPVATATRVRVGNLPGTDDPDMATVERVEARLSFPGLFSGRIVVEQMNLIGPEVRLERASDGSPNWRFDGAAPERLLQVRVLGPLTSGIPVIVQTVAVENGVVLWRRADGNVERFDGVSALLRSDGPDGPFALDGKARVREQDVALTVSTGRMAPERPTPLGVSVAVATDALKVRFNGTVGPMAATGIDGKLNITSADLGRILAALGIDAPKPLAAPLEVAANLKAVEAQAELDDLSARLGDVALSGSVKALSGTPMRVDANLSLTQLDLDAILAAMAKPGEASPPPPPTVTADPAPASAPLALPADLDARLDLNVGAMALGGGVIQQVRVNAELGGGVVTVNKAGALLPGNSDASLTGQVRQTALGPRFDGNLDLVSDNLRGLILWLGFDAGDVPADRLAKLQLTTRIGATDEVVQLAGVDLRLDASRVTGAAAVALRKRPSFSIDAVLDQINLDAYLPRDADGRTPGPPSLDRLAGFDTNFRLRVGQATWRETAFGGIDADLALLGGTLNVNRVAVEDLAGAKLNGGGLVRDLGGRPSLDLTLIIDAPDPAGLLRVAGLSPPQGALLGPGRLDLSLAGATEAQSLRLQATIGEANLGVTGTVTDLLGMAKADLEIEARAPSLANLARSTGLGFEPAPDADRPLAADGAFKGALDDGELQLGLDAGGGHVDVQGRIGLAPAGTHGDVAVSARAGDGVVFLRGIGVSLKPAPAADAAGQPLGLVLDTKATWDADAYALSGFKASFGPADLVLDAKLMRGARPKLEATASVGDLDLTRLPIPLGEVDATAARWSTVPVPLAWLRDTDGALSFAARRIAWTGGETRDVRGKASFEAGALVLSDAGASLWGGALGVDARVNATADGVAFSIDGRLANADFAAAGFDRTLRLTGRFDARLGLAGQGASPAAWMASLAGNVDMTARDGTFVGFDLPKLATDLDAADRPTETVAIVARDLAGGATPYRGLDAGWTLADGIARPRTFHADLDKAQADIAAVVDLPAFTVDARGTFTLIDHPKAPAIAYALNGPVDAPTQHVDGTALAAWAAQRAGDRAASGIVPGAFVTPGGKPAAPN
jgi:uncharacterized protein involved in outer membrane biogenesis